MADIIALQRRMNDALSSLHPWSLSDDELEAAILRLRRAHNRCVVEVERLKAEQAARRQARPELAARGRR